MLLQEEYPLFDLKKYLHIALTLSSLTSTFYLSAVAPNGSPPAHKRSLVTSFCVVIVTGMSPCAVCATPSRSAFIEELTMIPEERATTK